MSIKRISRRRVAAPVNTSVDLQSDTRTGGDVETKINPPAPSDNLQSRTGSNVETRAGTSAEWGHSTKEGTRAEPEG
jgi:hypothetical protein